MATLTSIPKHNAALTGRSKPSTGRIFYGWMFWFTEPQFSLGLTPITKHNGALTTVAKH